MPPLFKNNLPSCTYTKLKNNLFSQNIPSIVDERISEHLTDISDIGRPRSALMKEFVCPQLNWVKLKEVWWYTPHGGVSSWLLHRIYYQSYNYKHFRAN